MVKEFKSTLLTPQQAERIVEILVQQCNRIEERKTIDEKEFPDLYDEEYSKGRTHGDTAAVYAGFQEDTEIPGIKIHKHKYGRLHFQPELTSENSIIQIYSSDASLDIQEIKDKCEKHNTDFSKQKYGVLQFWMSKKGHLTSVDIVEFDKNASEIRRENIFKYRAKVIRVCA